MIPEIVLTLTDGETEFKVGVVGRVSIDPDAETITIPDPDDPAEPIVLVDFLIVEFARAGMYGLRLISERPLAATPPDLDPAPPPGAVARQDAERLV